jgi:magnesium transporter
MIMVFETIQHNDLKWYHILTPTEENLTYLKDNFNFHPLDIEDCRSKTQRPKIDIYDDYYFIILHFPYYDKVNRFIKTKEVKIFWGKDYIITIGNSHWVVRDLFNKAKENIKLTEEFLADSSDKLLYRILERILSETFILLSKLGEEVDTISRELFSKRAEKSIERISVTRKNIILLDTIFKPQLRLFHKFESGEIKGFAQDMEEYWGNILDFYQKIWDLVEDDKELIEGLSKTFDSLQTNKINEIMKVLTFISTIILPLTFITGLYGMNINLPFQGHPLAFWIVSGVMLLIFAILIFYFKRKRWM